MIIIPFLKERFKTCNLIVFQTESDELCSFDKTTNEIIKDNQFYLYFNEKYNETSKFLSSIFQFGTDCLMFTDRHQFEELIQKLTNLQNDKLDDLSEEEIDDADADTDADTDGEIDGEIDGE